MKWIIVIVVLGLYLAGLQRLSHLAFSELRQVQAYYDQIINHPEVADSL